MHERATNGPKSRVADPPFVRTSICLGSTSEGDGPKQSKIHLAILDAHNSIASVDSSYSSLFIELFNIRCHTIHADGRGYCSKLCLNILRNDMGRFQCHLSQAMRDP
ncbi:hypothetical protein KCU81_g693, partial [Aureobasidium melanogenum]